MAVVVPLWCPTPHLERPPAWARVGGAGKGRASRHAPGVNVVRATCAIVRE